MTQYVAFLRAINVGGHNVKMEDLRKLFESFGFTAVETFIASGNIIFETDLKSDRELERQIEAKLHEALGYEVATFIRTTAEIAKIARYRPFDESKLQAAQALNVAFLSEALSEDAQKTLQGLTTEIDEFHTHGREMYWLCKKKQSESIFSNAIFERKLKVQATFRGWNTILKLAAKYPPDAG